MVATLISAQQLGVPVQGPLLCESLFLGVTHNMNILTSESGLMIGKIMTVPMSKLVSQ